jgi:Fe-S oxidoreductase
LSLQNPAFAPTIRTALSPNINQGQPAAILLVEFSGESKEPLLPHLRDLVTLMGDLGLPGSVVEMVDDAAQKNLWEVRKAGLNIMMSLKGDGKPVSFIEDCAVPLEHLAEYTDALTEVFARHGTKGTWYAHASVGTLHVRPILDMRRDGAAKMRSIAQEASELVRKFKGAYSGEHGDGLCRGEWIRWQFGDRIHQAFGQIKQWMDPIGLYSPHRIIDPPVMDDARLFRFPPSYRVIPIQTALDWSEWNVQADPVTEAVSAPGTGGDPAKGFAKAVEMCNNNGHCRKFDSGTMCPSYRVTRDEQHLTRGRANTLRLALSGQLGTAALTDPALFETMDLCVSCKGCKRECPTGVDMAKMKVEFLHQYKQHHGHTMKDHLIAHLPRYASLASRLAPLLNLRNRWPWLARMGERWLGLSAQRAWPQWHTRHAFNTPQPGADIATVLRSDRGVVLFVDTFNGYFESENARAAYQVLQAAGYVVHVAHRPDRHLCCGRTYLSSGMVDQAREQVSALVDYLLPFAQHGRPIVGLEPSCLLTLRDEALSMGLGEDARTVAQQALLWEEFLDREQQAGRLVELQQQLLPAQAPFLLHGHCHQKAFDLVSPIQRVLAMIPDSKTQLIETSCCGMAGSFGYDAKHQEVSMAMAQLSLLPTLAKQPDAWVVADGTSCRHQIDHGAQRQALHVAQVLAKHLRT